METPSQLLPTQLLPCHPQAVHGPDDRALCRPRPSAGSLAPTALRPRPLTLAEAQGDMVEGRGSKRGLPGSGQRIQGSV